MVLPATDGQTLLLLIFTRYKSFIVNLQLSSESDLLKFTKKKKKKKKKQKEKLAKSKTERVEGFCVFI